MSGDYKTLTDGETTIALFKGRNGEWQSMGAFEREAEATLHVATARRKEALNELLHSIGPDLYYLDNRTSLALDENDLVAIAEDFDALISALREETRADRALEAVEAKATEEAAEKWDRAIAALDPKRVDVEIAIAS